MKNIKHFQLSALLVLVFAVSLAQAGNGGERNGPSACSFANTVCKTNEPVITEQTWVCVFDNANEVGFALVVTPSTDQHIDDVRLLPVEPGKLGAPKVYTAEGFKLSVIADASERPGYLTVSSLGLNELPMSCQ